VRRTRSALKLFGDAIGKLSADELAFFAAEFKWVGDLTTPTRDLDVHLLADLPAGPVSARIGGLVAPRALLPVVTASTATTVYRLLNGDGKTVARLLVTCPSLTGREQLPPRLAVTEVRGYLGQARRAARLVASVTGV